ncbi:MAG: hypothetical protein FWC65_02725 [Treponema sp.]|nr:hypothetical protein [Treponema sp.]
MAGMYPDNETISLFGEEISWPGIDPDTGKFTNGDFSNPLKRPSCIPAETINLILDNLAGLITGLGGEPDNSGADQLKNAVLSHINGRASTALPLMDGGASTGAAAQFARGDHRHPTDTTRAPLASPALTGAPTAPTAAANNNSAQIATTAYADRAGHPAGSCYIQFPISGRSDLDGMFPANEAPAALFGGTWSLEYDTEEVFFRTPGPSGNVGANRGRAWSAAQQWGASGGVAGIEPDAIRNIQGVISRFRLLPSTTQRNGVFETRQVGSDIAAAGTSSAAELEINASWALPTDTVNHPRNRLIRIWKRTA